LSCRFLHTGRKLWADIIWHYFSHVWWICHLTLSPWTNAITHDRKIHL
jgi:hypothetical protein